MPYSSHDKQIEEMRKWRARRKANNKLKALGYSNKEIKELNDTINNKKWRMSHLYKIRNKDGQLVVFKPNRAQQEFMDGAHCKNIILKSRQLGFTTYEDIDNLDEALFNENFQALMIFHTKVAAEDSFFNKITLAWENLPEGMQKKFKVSKDRAGEMVFQHAKGIYSSVACRTSGMAGTYSRLHVSEYAPMCDEEPAKGNKLKTETFPAIPDTGRIDIESTARGNSGEYYDMYTEALKNYLKLESQLEFSTGEMHNSNVQLDAAEWKPWFFNWTYDDEEIEKVRDEFYRKNGSEKKSITDFLDTIHPEILKYQKIHILSDIQIIYYWRKIKSKGGSLENAWKLVKQEYPTTISEAFEAKTDHLFDLEKIQELLNQTTIAETVNGWTYYKGYKPNHAYGIGVDVAEGIGRDSSAITILDFGKVGKIGENAEVVATYVNDKIAPDILAYEIRNGARLYGNPIVAVELNNHMGGTTVNELKGIYNNIYHEVRTDKMTNVVTERLGWLTTGKTKGKMFYDLKTCVEEDEFICPSRDVLNEMMTYNKSKLNTVRMNKDETRHWDLLTSCAIAYQTKEFAKPSKVKRKKVEDKEFDKFSVI